MQGKKELHPVGTGPQSKNSRDKDACRGNKSIYSRILDTLDRRCYKKNGLISLPDTFLCLSWLRISKKDSYEILTEMEELGLFELRPFRGILLKKGAISRDLDNKTERVANFSGYCFDLHKIFSGVIICREMRCRYSKWCEILSNTDQNNIEKKIFLSSRRAAAEISTQTEKRKDEL